MTDFTSKLLSSLPTRTSKVLELRMRPFANQVYFWRPKLLNLSLGCHPKLSKPLVFTGGRHEPPESTSAVASRMVVSSTPPDFISAVTFGMSGELQSQYAAHSELQNWASLSSLYNRITYMCIQIQRVSCNLNKESSIPKSDVTI